MIELFVCDPYGALIDVADNFLKLSYKLVTNAVGALVVQLPISAPAHLYPLDGRVFVNRTLRNGTQALEGQQCWFLRHIERVLSERGESMWELTAYSGLYMLERIVAYNSGSAQASKTDFADDMMKDIIRENFGSAATDAARNLSAYLSVQADTGQGPSITKRFARRKIIPTLQELSQQSLIAGTHILFDVVAPTTTSLQFRTYKNLRGIDNRIVGGANPILIAPEAGNVFEAARGVDHSDEITFVYGAGQGEGSERTIVEVSDATRIGLSPFNRREELRDARNASTTATVTAEAQASLRDGIPEKIFDVGVNENDALRYGTHWNLGDWLTVQFDGARADCAVDGVQVSVERGRETIKPTLRML